MAVESQSFRLGPAMGLSQRWSGPPNGAQSASDLAWDTRGGWRTGPGYRELLRGQPAQQGGPPVSPWTGVGEIYSMHFFKQGIGAREWLLFEAGAGSATLYSLNPAKRSGSPWDALVDRDGETVTDRLVMDTPWLRTWSVTWGNCIYLFNGKDRPIVFDGTMCDRAGFDAPPGAPQARVLTTTAATYVGGGGGQLQNVGIGPVPLDTTLAPYTHQRKYRVGFINDRGQESPPSAGSVAVSRTTGTDVQYSFGRGFHYLNLPIGPSNTVARVIYATDNLVDADGNAVLGRAETWYFLQYVEDNSTDGIEIFLDDDALASTATEASNFGAWPTNARMGVQFKETMFLLTTDASEVLYSVAGSPEVFPLKNRVPLGDAHLGPGTGIFATQNAVVVLKGQGVYLIKGDPSTGFYAETLDHSHGTHAPRTVIEIPGVGLAWLSSSGVSILEGALNNEGVPTRVRNIEIPVFEDVQTWTPSALIQAHAVASPREKEIQFHIPINGVATPNHCLVYHTDNGQWTTRPNFPAACSVSTGDEKALVLFGSWDADHPGIHAISRGFGAKDNVAVSPVYETVDLDVGGVFRDASVLTVMVQCVGFGDNDLILDYKTARRPSYIRASAGEGDQGADQQYPEGQNRMKVYGAAAGDYVDTDGDDEVAVWDTDRWGSWRPITVRFDVSTAEQNPSHEFAAKITVDSPASLMEIISIQIELRGGELNKAKPLPMWPST